MGFAPKLSKEQKIDMRKAYIEGESIASIAERFNVSKVTVHNYSKTSLGNKNKKTWQQMRKEYKIRELDAQSYEEIVEEEAVKLANEKSKIIPPAEILRIRELKEAEREIKKKLKNKVSAKDFIALSKFLLEIREMLNDRDKVYIIPAPEVDQKELDKIYNSE